VFGNKKHLRDAIEGTDMKAVGFQQKQFIDQHKRRLYSKDPIAP
jgi:hypothetical protein